MELRPAVDVFAFAHAPPPTSVDDGASDSLRHGLDKALYKSQWSVAVRWLDENHLLDAEAEASSSQVFAVILPTLTPLSSRQDPVARTPRARNFSRGAEGK